MLTGEVGWRQGAESPLLLCSCAKKELCILPVVEMKAQSVSSQKAQSVSSQRLAQNLRAQARAQYLTAVRQFVARNLQNCKRSRSDTNWGGDTWRYHRRSDTHAKQRHPVIACVVPAGQQQSNTKAKQHAACLGPAGRPKKCAPRNTRLRPSEGEGTMVCIERKSRQCVVGHLQLYLLSRVPYLETMI